MFRIGEGTWRIFYRFQFLMFISQRCEFITYLDIIWVTLIDLTKDIRGTGQCTLQSIINYNKFDQSLCELQDNWFTDALTYDVKDCNLRQTTCIVKTFSIKFNIP